MRLISAINHAETLLQRPFYSFSEKVNAYLEQVNETIGHNDPILIAFTLTTDQKKIRACPLAK